MLGNCFQWKPTYTCTLHLTTIKQHILVVHSLGRRIESSQPWPGFIYFYSRCLFWGWYFQKSTWLKICFKFSAVANVWNAKIKQLYWSELETPCAGSLNSSYFSKKYQVYLKTDTFKMSSYISGHWKRWNFLAMSMFCPRKNTSWHWILKRLDKIYVIYNKYINVNERQVSTSILHFKNRNYF